MKLIFVVASIFIMGTLAGSPAYSPSSYASSGWICDKVREVIRQLSQAALDALKDAIRSRITGKSDEVDGATKSKLLTQAIIDIKADQNISDNDKKLLDGLLDQSSLAQRSEGWNFDLDSVWECLKEIFSDLFNEPPSSSAPESSSPESSSQS